MLLEYYTHGKNKSKETTFRVSSKNECKSSNYYLSTKKWFESGTSTL